VVFLVGFAAEIAVDHAADGGCSVYVEIISALFTFCFLARLVCAWMHAPGNRMNFTCWPSFSSASTSIWHCVVFPARSRPSNTMSLPRAIVQGKPNVGLKEIGRSGQEVADRAASAAD